MNPKNIHKIAADLGANLQIVDGGQSVTLPDGTAVPQMHFIPLDVNGTTALLAPPPPEGSLTISTGPPPSQGSPHQHSQHGRFAQVDAAPSFMLPICNGVGLIPPSSPPPTVHWPWWFDVTAAEEELTAIDSQLTISRIAHEISVNNNSTNESSTAPARAIVVVASRCSGKHERTIFVNFFSSGCLFPRFWFIHQLVFFFYCMAHFFPQR